MSASDSGNQPTTVLTYHVVAEAGTCEELNELYAHLGFLIRLTLENWGYSRQSREYPERKGIFRAVQERHATLTAEEWSRLVKVPLTPPIWIC